MSATPILGKWRKDTHIIGYLWLSKDQDYRVIHHRECRRLVKGFVNQILSKVVASGLKI